MSRKSRTPKSPRRSKASAKLRELLTQPTILDASSKAPETVDNKVIRQFSTGATRDTAAGKFDFDGFISPLVLEAFGTYMDFNRLLPDGSTRDSDNWQKGIPTTAYMKSGWRHFIDWWRYHRGLSVHENIVWAICGLLFNANGYLHETLKADPTLLEKCKAQMTEARDKRFAALKVKV